MYGGVTRGAQVTGIVMCSLSLTWISTILRFYVRISILKFVGREDWLTVAAMIPFTIFCSLCMLDEYYGLGAHMENIDAGFKQTGFKIIFVCELLYVVSTTVTKLSISAYFLRLSIKKYQRVVIFTTLSMVLIFSTMYFFFLLFQCTPINFLWTQYGNGQGTCLRSPILASVTYAHCAMSALTDWSFGILPIFFVWKMRMTPRTKLSVILVLSLGFFASTATIVRIVYIKSLTDTDDYSWEGINLVKWSMVEPAIAITAMNIATLRPMFNNFFHFASSKRLDNTVDSEEGRSSDDSQFSQKQCRGHANYVNANEYSVEFAQLLGLSRVGVTTSITAGGSEEERKQMKNIFMLGKRSRSAMREKYDTESQTGLNSVPMPEDSIDWSGGIKATTVVTQSRQ